MGETLKKLGNHLLREVSQKMREIECVKIRRENEELGGKRRRTVEKKEDGGREGGRWKRRRTVEEKEDGGREGVRWKRRRTVGEKERRSVMWCMEENVWRARG